MSKLTSRQQFLRGWWLGFASGAGFATSLTITLMRAFGS